jgi:hypothetical protein
MTLREYLFINDMKAAHFARKIRYNELYIQKVAKGTASPGWRLAEKIVEATEGAVRMEDLLPKKAA